MNREQVYERLSRFFAEFESELKRIPASAPCPNLGEQLRFGLDGDLWDLAKEIAEGKWR